MPDSLPNPDLDLAFLYEIADGSNEFIVESITMFLDQTPQLLDTISSAIAAHDWVTAGSAAHKLKPNLGFFGMPQSQADMQEVELLCKEGERNSAGIIAKFNNIKSVVTSSFAQLEKIKAEGEANL
jgi:HPt (histidine-containing phosphotransfer) domain-containing protein